MRNQVVGALTVAAFLGAAASAGADPYQDRNRSRSTPAVPPKRHVPATVAPTPSHLAAGDQYYEGSLSGFRDYLNAIESNDPELFAAMDPRLSSLESRSTWASVALWGGVLLGLGLAITPAFFEDDCKGLSPLSPEWDTCHDDARSDIYTFGALGGIVMAGGFITAYVLRPNRRDMMNLVNEHNRLRPEAPVQLQLGYDPTRGTGYAGLTVHFD